MAALQEKLADSLATLKSLQERGLKVIQSKDLGRTDRERLLTGGYLRVIIKGWYLPTHPGETEGEFTAWYASFWDFCVVYLNKRFADDWSISPEQSILLHVGNNAIPDQLLVRSPKARNRITELPFDKSILDMRAALPEKNQVEVRNNLRVFSLEAALVQCKPAFFASFSTDARTALAMISDPSGILSLLLSGGKTIIAGRLAGAFRNIGRNDFAEDIIKTMKSAGYDVRERDPFSEIASLKLAFHVQQRPPFVNRIRLMWHQMRESIIGGFSKMPDRTIDINTFLEEADDKYITDAYHSLSIEGYRVTPELIDKVRSGDWSPAENQTDQELRNALIARGYWQAYQAVRESLQKVLNGHNPGVVAAEDHRSWYREMFTPSVTAGLLNSEDLAGYRNSQVYIRHSRHIPMRYEAVRECMPAFFELLGEEVNPFVRIVLGHFIFVYIHPYMDGNGRIGRFLMNLMIAAAGYPWTVIPLESRDTYIATLEKASVKQDIKPFSNFLSDLIEKG